MWILSVLLLLPSFTLSWTLILWNHNPREIFFYKLPCLWSFSYASRNVSNTCCEHSANWVLSLAPISSLSEMPWHIVLLTYTLQSYSIRKGSKLLIPFSNCETEYHPRSNSLYLGERYPWDSVFLGIRQHGATHVLGFLGKAGWYSETLTYQLVRLAWCLTFK